MEKCKSIFPWIDPHTWKYFSNEHRVCQKCGLMQYSQWHPDFTNMLPSSYHRWHEYTGEFEAFFIEADLKLKEDKANEAEKIRTKYEKWKHQENLREKARKRLSIGGN